MKFSKKIQHHIYDRVLDIVSSLGAKKLIEFLPRNLNFDERYIEKLLLIKNKVDKIFIEKPHLKNTHELRDSIQRLEDLVLFVKSGAKIYKFNNEFLDDYLSYPLNFSKLLETQSLNLDFGSIILYAQDIGEVEHEKTKRKYSVITLTTNQDTNLQNYIILQLSSLDHPYNFLFVCKTTEKFNLIEAYKNEENCIKTDINRNEVVKKIIKLLFYIKSNNVDLREIVPEIPENNTKKEKDKTDLHNSMNDSFIFYFKVGYGWNKLPLYVKDEWETQGHFRMQACGKNHQEHKIVFINPHIRKRKKGIVAPSG
jgi:hypothetical protein